MNQENSGRVLRNLPLLHDLLNAKFHSAYEMKSNSIKKKNTSEDPNPNRIYFCVDCRGESLTKSEVDVQHVNHRTLRAVKCSENYGYIKEEIINVLPKDIVCDISKVYDFKINAHSIYFPKSRKKNNLGNNNNNIIEGRCCIKCKHVLPMYGYEYCSIDCLISCTNHDLERHLELMRSNDHNRSQNQVIRLPPLKKKGKITVEMSKNNQNKRQKNSKVSSGLGSGVDFESLATVATKEADEKKVARNGGLSYRKRSRKGIPHRAPFY